MIDLTFLTSSITKLAHARYIAEDRPFRIKGFRERTYHADYKEPRLTSRQELLDASYRSAIEQCIKAGIHTRTHIFFLEDTSVRIDALSTEKKDVPGLDIKYWMKDRSFDQLDELLRAPGKNRSASVRSDVLMHVPDAYRERWNIPDEIEYLVFTGIQRGEVIERDYVFETNLVFPWLDNQTFNRWFRPIGANEPLGALDVSVADKFDFRRVSFEKMFEFLDGRHRIEKHPTQASLQLQGQPHLLICGYTCAGKTTAGQHLSKKFGCLHVEASDFIYLSYYRRHGFHGNVSINDFAEQALVQKPQIAAEKIIDYMHGYSFSPAVISGFRSRDETNWLKEKLSLAGERCQTIFVDADQRTRFGRLNGRMRIGDDISYGQFQLRDEQQMKMGLDKIRESKDTILWNNMETLDMYLEMVEDHIWLKRIPETDLKASIDALKWISHVKLEDGILIVLLSVWSVDEIGSFHTTTEIASMINNLFLRINPKHKDNVSRYFNQDFYVYYEIDHAGGSGVRRYRLSNTGYGHAVQRLAKLLEE